MTADGHGRALPGGDGDTPADGAGVVGDRTRSPLEGDAVAPLDVEVVGGDDLALSLDQDLAASAQFLLYVDPSVSGSLQGRAYVQSGWPTTAHWDDVTNYQLGGCAAELGCSSTSVNRSFFQFNGLGKVGADTGDVRGVGRERGLCFGVEAVREPTSAGHVQPSAGSTDEPGHHPGHLLRDVGHVAGDQ